MENVSYVENTATTKRNVINIKEISSWIKTMKINQWKFEENWTKNIIKVKLITSIYIQ